MFKRNQPRRIVQRGRTFTRQSGGEYRSDDGGVLDALVLAAVLSGNGSAHGCTVDDHSAGFVSGGGSFGGGGTSDNSSVGDPGGFGGGDPGGGGGDGGGGGAGD